MLLRKENKFLNRVIVLFLIRYGLVIVDEYRMYYKTLRSRVMFEKMLWNENKCLNQKFFYCDIYLKDVWVVKTNKKRLIDKEQEQKIIDYLTNLNINIRYFEKFEGHIFLVQCENSKQNVNYPFKAIGICFMNNLYKNKIRFLLVKEKKDIEFFRILLKNYLINDSKIRLNSNSIFEFLRNDAVKSGFNYFSIQIGWSLINFLKYFDQYMNLLLYIDNNILDFSITSIKNCLFFKTKENINFQELNNFFYNKKLLNLYEIFKENFLNFEGICFLVEIELIDNTMILKRFIIIFLNSIDSKIYIFPLFDINYLEFILNVLKYLLIEYNDKLSDYKLNLFKEELPDIVNLKKREILEQDITDNIEIININNFQHLIFMLEYYKLFL